MIYGLINCSVMGYYPDCGVLFSLRPVYGVSPLRPAQKVVVPAVVTFVRSLTWVIE
jgi:hypothetical protein